MNIISYSLWGENPKYIIGAHKNIELAEKYFPDWKVRIYLSTKTPFKTNKENVQIVMKEQKSSQDGCFWRFEACDSDDVVIVRDLDDRLSERHKFVVDEWLSSDKNLHIIRDHPNHVYPIMAGLWGSRNGMLKGLNSRIESWENKDYYTCDQIFLQQTLYNSVFMQNTMVHDPFRKNLGIEKDINRDRVDFEFLGDTFNENDERVENYWKIIQEHKNK